MKNFTETEKKLIREYSKGGFTYHEISIITGRNWESIKRLLSKPVPLTLNEHAKRLGVTTEPKNVYSPSEDHYNKGMVNWDCFTELFNIKKDRTECFPVYKIR